MISAQAAGPGGAHAHTAPLAGVTLSAGGSSPQFNYADTYWNHGEGFAAPADSGGYHGFDDGTSVTPNNIKTTLGWVPFAVANGGGTPVQRFLGELAPSQAYSGPILAAFEVFAPVTWDHSKPTIVVLSCHPTQADNSYVNDGRFGYPGKSSPGDGLSIVNGAVLRAEPASDFVASYSGTAAVDQFNIVAAYIVTPVGHRDLTLSIQRYLQLEQAVQLILTTTTLLPPGLVPSGTQVPDVRYPVVAVGGSMGGLSSQILAMFFPRRFQGAVSAAFSGLLRRTVTNQEMFTAICGLSGFGKTGTAYTRRDTLGWSVFFRQFEAYLTDKYSPDAFDIDFLSGSFWAHWQAGQVVRPQYFIFSDEDGVTNGNEWLSLFEEERSGISQSRATGYLAKPSAVPGRQKEMFWSIIDKGCHDSGNYQIPDTAGGGYDEDSLRKASFKFLKYAYASFLLDQTSPVPEHPNFGLISGAPAVKSRYDAYNSFLGRTETSQRNTTAGPSSLLTEDTSFGDINRGCGTWLGDDESLVVSGGYVYVGSADGIVSKLQLNTTTKQLNVVQQSQSLGYGAYGLVDAGATSLVVGTYNKLWVLNKSSLAVTGSLSLDWEESRPGRLQFVTDLLASGSGEYIVFRSQFGQLVVVSLGGAGGLTKVLSYGEPGIQDLVVGGTASAGYSKPIYIQSERGHVIKLGIDTGNNVHVLAASEPKTGHPLDLELLPGVGVLALYGGIDQAEVALKDTLRIFDSSLTQWQIAKTEVGAHAGKRPGRASTLPFIGDVELLVDGTGTYFIVLRGSMLSKVSNCGSFICLSQIELGDFLPTAYPMAMKLGDLDGDGSPEIVLSTESGSVAWLPMSVLDGSGVTYAAITAGASTSPLAYCSGVPVATWAMTEDGPNAGKISAVDQCSRRWEIDGVTGVATFQEYVPDSVGAANSFGDVVSKPFRDLGYLGFTPAAVASPPQLPLYRSPHPTKTAVTLGAEIPVVALLGSVHVNSAGIMDGYFPLPPSWNSAAHEWVFPLHYQDISLGFSAFHVGGDVQLGQSGVTHAYWWTGFPGALNSPNSVWGVFGNASSVAPWASSEKLGSAGSAHHFRTVFGDGNMNQQSLRMGTWSGVSRPIVVLSTGGGSIIVVDPAPGTSGLVQGQVPNDRPNVAPNGDHGFGGTALVVSPVQASGAGTDPWIVMGTIETHARGVEQMHASLHVYKRDTSPFGLLEVQSLRMDGLSGRPFLYGFCGLAIGDVNGDSDDELIATTYNGDLVVFDLSASSGNLQIGTILFWTVLDGAIGVANSIVIADLDSGTAGNEIYVAGSRGMRKFHR